MSRQKIVLHLRNPAIATAPPATTTELKNDRKTFVTANMVRMLSRVHAVIILIYAAVFTPFGVVISYF